MANTWYKNSMLKVKDADSIIKELSASILSIKGVKSVLVWGSYIKNANNPDYILRDIDIIAVNKFHSGDLLSITEGDGSLLKMSSESLEEEGYNPDAVSFTKKFTAIKNYNIDHWSISKDNKLLHWGPFIEDKKEWDEIKKDADEYANFSTGSKREALHTASLETQERWKIMHEHYLNRFFSQIPNGWYLSDHKVKTLLAETKIILSK